MLQCNFGVVFFVCLFALVFLTCKNSGLVPRGFSSDEVSFNRMTSYVLKKKEGEEKKGGSSKDLPQTASLERFSPV